MRFPKWVNKPGTTKQERAANRLRYLVLRLSLELDPRNTLQVVADRVGMSHVTISLYITRGYFSPAMAARFEDTFGRESCPNEWLRDPMLIPVAK